MLAANLRIVIFTSAGSPYAPLILERVVKRHPDVVKTIVTLKSSSGGYDVKKIRSSIKKAGLRYTFLKLLLFGSVKIQQMLGLFPSIKSLCNQFKMEQISLETVHSPRDIEIIRSLHPDIIISILFEKIFPPDMLKIPTRAALNFHPAPLPRYAGIAPTFWVLSNGEKETGVSLHILNEGIDTGDLVAQEILPIYVKESVHSLYLRCCITGGELISNSILDICSGRLCRIVQKSELRVYFTAPTKLGYKSLRKHGHSLFSVNDMVFPLKGNS